MYNIANIRKRKFQAIGWGTLAVGCILFVWFFINTELWTEGYRQQKLTVLNQGERTTATIISQRKWIGYLISDTYVINYTFTLPSGQEQTGHYVCYDYLPSGWEVGNRITVAYDPQDPEMNLPVNAKYEKEDLYVYVGWFGLIIVSLVCCAGAFYFGRKAWRTWKLSKLGGSRSVQLSYWDAS